MGMCLWPRGNRTTQWWCGWRVTVGTVGASWLSRARTNTDYSLAGTARQGPQRVGFSQRSELEPTDRELRLPRFGHGTLDIGIDAR